MSIHKNQMDVFKKKKTLWFWKNDTGYRVRIHFPEVKLKQVILCLLETLERKNLILSNTKTHQVNKYTDISPMKANPAWKSQRPSILEKPSVVTEQGL